MNRSQRIAYTVSWKNPLVYLAILVALAALTGAFARAFIRACGALWPPAVLPALAALFFVYQLSVHGKDRLYRLSLPVWALTLGLALVIAKTGFPWYRTLALALAALVTAGLVHRALAGRLGRIGLACVAVGSLLLALLTVLVFCCLGLQPAPWDAGAGAVEVLAALAEPLLLAAYLPLCLAVRQVNDGNYHPTWGDRSDGRRLRSLNPISCVGAYAMPERNQADVFFQDKLEITELEKYIRSKRAQGFEQFGMTEVLLAAYVRTVSKYPGTNRFVAGSKIYARGDDIQFCMVVKKEMTTQAPDTVVKIHLKPGDGMEEVYRKFHAAVDEAKKSMELDSGMDGLAALLGMIPGVLLKFLVWLLKLLDYFGLLPRWFLELSPFHGSVFFTSMASLGIPAVLHHLYNFGNLPIFIAFGRKNKVNELLDDGTVVTRKYMDYSMNVDERTVDGFYYATIVKYFHKLLLHPERLDDPDMEINEDVP